MTMRQTRVSQSIKRSPFAFLVIAGTLACSDLGGTGPLPAGVQDPKTFETREGALSLYRTTLVDFQRGRTQGGAFTNTVIEGGLLSDEFESGFLGGSPFFYSRFGLNSAEVKVFTNDSRNLQEQVTEVNTDIHTTSYNILQSTRGSARLAIGALMAYAPDESPALRGHLYAIAGYAELLLADLFCSGVPLSTVEFGGDFIYQPGSRTEVIYARAVALFDTAISLSADSARILNLARVGKARALLNLGRYAEIPEVVNDVPDDFRYEFPIVWGTGPVFATQHISVSDREGGQGLPYRSWNDPRTPTYARAQNQFQRTVYFPSKYQSSNGVSTGRLASGVEARLMQAEAALNAGSPMWLTLLNALRTDGTFTTTPNPNSPGGVDTTWNAGIGGVAGLRPLTDPGSDTARVTLLYTERAAWLFATGHRQGDLRRLVRNYQRPADAVYPSGAYGAYFDRYGTDVNLPIPPKERLNPRFTGCINRDA
jgi:hypothetical protein